MQKAARLALVVGREEGEGFHELVALGNRNVAVVQLPRGFAVDVEPPVALQDGLVEQCGLRTQEALHDESVVREGAHVEHLEDIKQRIRYQMLKLYYLKNYNSQLYLNHKTILKKPSSTKREDTMNAKTIEESQ